MTKVFVFILSLAFAATAAAQETVIWAAEVLDVSSEFGPLEYSALQVLHKPNVLPGGGQNPNSWRPKRPDKYEFVTVAFDEPIVAKQVAIAESENPGAVTAVYAYDEDFNEYPLFELTPTVLPLESRLLNLFFGETAYPIKAIRVELSGDLVPGHNAIDAIGISNANIPISVLIRIARGVNQQISSEQLSNNVNSPYIDHGPIISPDGKRLYFSRQYHPDNTGGVDDPEDIWVSEFDEENRQWQPARNVGPPLNNEGPNFISTILMVDGEEVFVLGNRYGKKGRMSVGTSLSKYVDGTFTNPEALEIENDYNYDKKADFFLAPGGEILLISAERDATHGLRDLYVSFKTGDTWTEPENLGNAINTIAMETAPFMSVDNETLYFSSAGHTGHGGLDIYVAHRLDDTWLNWSEPENLGPAINTEFDDEYFSIPGTGSYVYFTRGNVNENTDIFRFEANDFLVTNQSPLYPSIEHLLDVPEEITEAVALVSVRHVKTQEPLPRSRVSVRNLSQNEPLEPREIQAEAEFVFSLARGQRYTFSAENEGFITATETIEIAANNGPDTVSVELLLEPEKVALPVMLGRIAFEFDMKRLGPEAFQELDRIVQILVDGDIERIEISGYTDSIGQENYNQQLSESRAKAVAEYFISKGVAADRIVTKGYGEENPISSNDTEEGRRQNRRVEFRILEVK